MPVTREALLAEMAQHGLDGHDADTRTRIILKTVEYVDQFIMPVVAMNHNIAATAINQEWLNLNDGDPTHLQCLVRDLDQYIESLAEWRKILSEMVERVVILQQIAEEEMMGENGGN